MNVTPVANKLPPTAASYQFTVLVDATVAALVIVNETDCDPQTLIGLEITGVPGLATTLNETEAGVVALLQPVIPSVNVTL